MEQLVLMVKTLDGHISDKDYLTCKKVRNEFNMKNMGDYHNHYVLKNVLLLADIDTCLKFYKLDPCRYFSSPGLSWDVTLKMSGEWLEKIIDIDIYLLIEKGLIGGISNIAKRYSKTNSKCMKKYDHTKPSIYISYLDMNNLYGWAMSDYLPYGRFKWLKDVNKFDVNSVSEISSTGYILEVDLKYPDKLNVLYNDYPLAPEKLAITCAMLSDYCKKIADKFR